MTLTSYQAPPQGAFYRTLKHFQFAFNWPRTNDLDLRKRHNLYNFLFKLVSLFNLISIMAHFIVNLKDNNFDVLVEDLALGSAYVGAMSALILIGLNEKKWSHFFRRLLDFRKFGTPPTYEKMVKRYNLYSIIIYVYGYLGTSLYCFIELTDTANCEKLNREGRNEICGTVAPFYWPRELTTMEKIILNVIQVASILLYSPQSAILIIFPSEAVDLLKTRVKHCAHMFLVLFDDPDEDHQTLANRLSFCVEYQIELLNIAEAFNGAFKRCIMHVSITATVVIACILTQLLTTYNLGAVTHVGGWISGIFLMCRAGQTFRDMLGAVGEAAYFSNWSQKPVILEAIPCGEHNYDFFVNLTKTSYSYLNLMNL
ncbi:uncharacterized protein LOC132705209 isoform X2 [Cylas formicarius]|uniref:uncharacterized protein LOC132705209 isoform X2 n=1 Tax=Cylas formicarius TaxID=197179 RepID=UPI002958A527|nr:uncharacterized protein LOC132705209 isoform X2 [Cylas formicarius]